jgi:hypothetical protein
MYDASEEAQEKRKGDERWVKLGFDHTTKFKPNVFNNLCEMFGEEEKLAAVENGEAPPAWVTAFEGMDKAALSDLFTEIELKPNNTINLPRYDKRLGKVVELPTRYPLNYKRRLVMDVKTKPAKGGKEAAAAKPATAPKTPAGKGPKVKAPKPIELKTLAENLVMEWLQHEMFTHMSKTHAPKPTRAAPAIKNWNAPELAKWVLEESDGTECYIFLTNSFEVKAKLRAEDKNYIFFCSFRVELNGLHTYEWLYHAKIYIGEKKEEIMRIDARPVQMCKSGEAYKLPRSAKPDFKNWSRHVPIPDIFASAVQPREF